MVEYCQWSLWDWRDSIEPSVIVSYNAWWQWIYWNRWQYWPSHNDKCRWQLLSFVNIRWFSTIIYQFPNHIYNILLLFDKSNLKSRFFWCKDNISGYSIVFSYLLVLDLSIWIILSKNISIFQPLLLMRQYFGHFANRYPYLFLLSPEKVSRVFYRGW